MKLIKMPARNRNKNKSSTSNGTHHSSISQKVTSKNPTASNSHKGRNKANKTGPQHSFFRTKKCVLCFFFVCTLKIFFFLLLKNYFSTYSGEYNPDDSISQILRKCVDIESNILLYQQQISAFLMGERLANVLKTKLQPIQDKVSSLRTQTSQYEKMERISGGPTKFMEDAAKILNDIEYNQLASLDDEVNRILIDEARHSKSLIESAKYVITRGDYGLEAMYNPKLMNAGIYLSPSEGYKDSYIEEQMTKHTLHDVLSALSSLADKYEAYENTFYKVEALKTRLGLTDWKEVDPKHSSKKTLSDETWDEIEDLVKNEMDPQRLAVEKEIKENHLLHILFIPLGSTVIESVANLQEELATYVSTKRRAYLELRDILKDDIISLRLRTVNLRYKYAKITTL